MKNYTLSLFMIFLLSFSSVENRFYSFTSPIQLSVTTKDIFVTKNNENVVKEPVFISKKEKTVFNKEKTANLLEDISRSSVYSDNQPFHHPIVFHNENSHNKVVNMRKTDNSNNHIVNSSISFSNKNKDVVDEKNHSSDIDSSYLRKDITKQKKDSQSTKSNPLRKSTITDNNREYILDSLIETPGMPSTHLSHRMTPSYDSETPDFSTMGSLHLQHKKSLPDSVTREEEETPIEEIVITPPPQEIGSTNTNTSSLSKSLEYIKDPKTKNSFKLEKTESDELDRISLQGIQTSASSPKQINKKKQTHEKDSKITVINHYFINDKSTVLKTPQNPKIYNLYDKKPLDLHITDDLHDNKITYYATPEMKSDFNYHNMHSMSNTDHHSNNTTVSTNQNVFVNKNPQDDFTLSQLSSYDTANTQKINNFMHKNTNTDETYIIPYKKTVVNKKTPDDADKSDIHTTTEKKLSKRVNKTKKIKKPQNKDSSNTESFIEKKTKNHNELISLLKNVFSEMKKEENHSKKHLKTLKTHEKQQKNSEKYDYVFHNEEKDFSMILKVKKLRKN